MKVDIVSGFLGAGKTTFINKYLPLLEGKSALIENEFGDVSIDTDLIIEEVPVKEIFAGCICCTLRGDFASGIKEIHDEFNPQTIVIEPSGVGRLSDVIQGIKDASRMTNINLEINKLVSLVDIDTYWDYKENFGPFYLDQIENANIIFLTNLEDFSDEEISKIAKDIAQLNKRAVIFSSDYRKLDKEDLIQVIDTAEVGFLGEEEKSVSNPADLVFSSFSIESKGLTEEKITQIIKEIEKGEFGKLLRLKGFISDGVGKIINYTPSKLDIEETDKNLDEVIVIIGTDLKRKSIKDLFN